MSGAVYAGGVSFPVTHGPTLYPYPLPHHAGPCRSNHRTYINTPGWRSTLATQGWLPVRTLVHQTYEVFSNIFTTEAEKIANQDPKRVVAENVGYKLGGHTLAEWEPTATTNSVYSIATSNAKSEVLSRARDMRVNLAVTIAEGHKTLDMLLGTAKTLGQAYGQFRHGRFKQAAKTLGIDTPHRTAANHWLAYSYGWKPLLSDAVGSATFLYDYFHRTEKPRYIFRKRVAGPEANMSQVRAFDYIASWLFTREAKRTSVGTAGLLVEIQSMSQHTQAQLGVGLTDPLLLAWELVPFSFVFDWFVDIGGWLENASSLQGLTVLTGWEACQYSYNWTCTWNGLAGHYDRIIVPPPVWRGRYTYYTRNVWTGGLPTLKTPLWDAIGARRLTTTAALLVQQLSGDRRKGSYRP
jgi:hypothetical protein